MTAPRPDPPPEHDDDSVPAGPGSRLVLTVAPFVVAALVWWLFRWFG